MNLYIRCVFLFFCFSVRKFLILLMLNGVFFPPPNFVLSKVWRFLFLIAIFFFNFNYSFEVLIYDPYYVDFKM